jgi:hypothetical protein
MAGLLMLVAGCSGDGGGTSAGAVQCNGASPVELSITDETNYSFQSQLSIQMTTLEDATDLTFDWSNLTRDFFGKPLDPAADIDMILIALWNLTPSELQESLNRDNLPRSSSEGAIMTYPDGSYTSQNLLSFGLLGNPLPDPEEIWKRFDTQNPDFQYPQDQHTFLLMASTGTTIGRGTRMLSLFNLDPASAQTELSITDESTTLDYSVDLKRAVPVYVPSGEPSVTVDWSSMTVNALGNEYLPTQVTEAAVAHFATDSLADLEAQFLSLEETAEGWWSGPVAAGTSIDLGTLLDQDNAPFTGIDDTGTWLVALFCTAGCNNPAPWSITFLKTCK